jgi:hypothetical protein
MKLQFFSLHMTVVMDTMAAELVVLKAGLLYCRPESWDLSYQPSVYIVLRKELISILAFTSLPKSFFLKFYLIRKLIQ